MTASSEIVGEASRKARAGFNWDNKLAGVAVAAAVVAALVSVAEIPVDDDAGLTTSLSEPAWVGLAWLITAGELAADGAGEGRCRCPAVVGWGLLVRRFAMIESGWPDVGLALLIKPQVDLEVEHFDFERLRNARTLNCALRNA